jgi:RND family efflux transporter MFP subunit
MERGALQVMNTTKSAESGLLRRLAAAAIVLAAGGALSACSDASSREPRQKGPVGEAKPALTVGVASVSPRPITRIVVGTGSIAAWQQLTVAAEIAGLRIVEIAVDEGDTVRQGQVLARLDDSILKAQLSQFEAAVLEAEANLANARAEFRRAEELQAGRNIAEATYQQRQTAARTGEARLGMIRAQRDEVKAKIEQTVIRAPTDGVISRRTALLGSVSSVGAELFRMIRQGRVELQAHIPELDIGRIKAGQAARVIRGDEAVDGTVRLVSPVVDASTRLGLAYVSVPADSGLKPGMFATAEINVGVAEALAVPQDALVFRDGRPGAYRVGADNRVSLRLIETGARQDGWVEVRAGLERSDRIVIAGAGFLSDGDLVRIDSAALTGPAAGSGVTE